MKKLYKKIVARLHSGSLPTGEGGGRGRFLLLLLGSMAFLSSCSDWDDHYENEAANSADITLWDAIQQRSELSDFAQVLEKTMVFRQHKKTSVSYADVLKGGRSLTLFAPVNGTFNKDSILSLLTTAKGDSAVERFFIMNHLSQDLISTDGTDKNFHMLNLKKGVISGDIINNVAAKETNVHGKNGIMHVMSSQMPYMKTIYETLVSLPQFKTNGDILKSYNEDVFDEDNSVSSEIVDGKKEYVDSVIYEENKLMNDIGRLNSEDSVYHAVIPNEDGWNKAYNKAMECYKFAKSNEYADSLQRYYAYRALMDDAIYSHLRQKEHIEKYALASSWLTDKYHRYGVYYNPFSPDGIFGSAKEKIVCSNGYIYASDEWIFDPHTTYNKMLYYEGEELNSIIDYSGCSLNEISVLADSISAGKFMHIKPSTGNSNWSVTYKLENALSTKYDIYLDVLPKSVMGSDSKRPCRFTATINYYDEDGNAKSFVCNDGTPINTEADHIHRVKVGSFRLPTCNYDQSIGQPSITITCSIRPNENSRYDRNFYLDTIYLYPSEEE